MAIAPFSFSQNKINTLIEQGNYEKAQQLLFKKPEKFLSDALLNFSAAYFYSFEDHPRFNLDSAWIYAMRCDSFLKAEKNIKTLDKWKKQGFRIYTLENLSKHIAQRAFQFSETENNPDAWEHFIQIYAHSELLPLAIEKRNDLAFQMAQKNFTYDSFKDFMEKYPNAAQVHEARKLYEELLYQTQTQKKTWLVYKKFAEQYPESPYKDEALSNYHRLLFEEYAASGSLQVFIEFEKKYPNHPMLSAIQDSVFKYFIQKGSPEEYYHFIQKFPNYPQVATAWKKYYLLSTSDYSWQKIENFKRKHPEFYDTLLLQEDLVWSQKDIVLFESDEELMGYFNKTDSVQVVPAQFYEAAEFSGRYAWVSDTACEDTCRYFYIHRKGQQLSDFYYQDASDFKKGYALVARGNCAEGNCLYGLIDQLGHETVPLIYQELYDVSDNYLLLAKNEQSLYGFVSAVGKIILPFRYQDAQSFSDGLAAVRTDSLWQYIDENGNAVITKPFYKAGKFTEGLAPAASSENLWGYIDYSGEWVIAPKYYFANNFENGEAQVIIQEKNKKGILISVQKRINKKGEIIPESKK